MTLTYAGPSAPGPPVSYTTSAPGSAAVAYAGAPVVTGSMVMGLPQVAETIQMPPTTVVAAPQYMAPQMMESMQMAPTTTVAPAQYMAPQGTSAVVTPMQYMAPPQEPIVMQMPATTMAAPVPMMRTELPSLPPTTVTAMPQYMAVPSQATPVTTQTYAQPVPSQTIVVPGTVSGYTMEMQGPVTTATGSSAAAMALQGTGGLGSIFLGGAMPVRGGLLKAGSITDDVFNMVDRNNDGVISRSEFRGALKGNIISATATTHLALGR